MNRELQLKNVKNQIGKFKFTQLSLKATIGLEGAGGAVDLGSLV